ncbi:MAG: D-glycero-beta-D-manno-heptose-7-phosphate kinase [Methylophilaceae bacterium]|nr:D-glycero-beta-D-manno-heptose-7-phosphate kinase [Methylophilaceae bacterium]
MPAKLIETVQRFSDVTNQWVLVIGDLMLDRYLIGDVQRISPEAPVPVVLLKQTNERAGGAANVAANLAGLGIKTRTSGIVGKDTQGQTLLSLLKEMGIETAGVFESEYRPTVAKTRIMSSHQQIVRLDQESSAPLNASEKKQLQAHVSQQLQAKPAIVILSDYAKGVLSDEACKIIIKECHHLKIPVIADPKGRDYSKYLGVTALTPNKKETAEACGIDQNDNEALLLAANQLRKTLHLEFLAVTRGEEGISLLDNHGDSDATHHIPATAKQVFDVSGAGDTVIATLAAGLINGLRPFDALQLANTAAGIVVGKIGTVPISQQELIEELVAKSANEQVNKIVNLNQLMNNIEAWRKQKQKIVFTNGCFDLLHAGHVTYLEAAKKKGDKLVLGLNTDRSVSAIKGPTRPVIHEADRARVLAALEAVDAVILFDEDTPLNLINTIKPHVIVKGSDYTQAQVLGGVEVKSWGGEIALIDVVPGRSTSGILEKIAG